MPSIAFVANQLSIRGTEVCIFDYAKGCRDILNMQVYIFYPEDCDMAAYEKFKEEFWPCITSYSSLQHLELMVKELNIENVYWIKAGHNDGKLVPGVKNIVHAVFNTPYETNKHGDVYAYVSRFLSEQNNKAPYVPHIVSLPDVKEDYKELLRIPKDAVVFGRHGGNDSFDDPEAHKVVYEIALNNPYKYFLFMNTDVFCPSMPNIIHLAPTHNVEVKTAFINTCDVMLHCRLRGETFGLAVCEFLHQNKPVITRSNSLEYHHVEVMGNKGFYYTTAAELYQILLHFKPTGYEYKKLVERFSTEKVMERFNELFIN